MALTIDDDERVHHMLLLVDAGHASWKGNLYPRITNAGYDFIAAYDSNQGVMKRFRKLMDEGIPYLQAVSAVMKLVTGETSE